MTRVFFYFHKPQYSPTPQFTCPCLSTTPQTTVQSHSSVHVSLSLYYAPNLYSPTLSSRVLVSLLLPKPQYSPTPQFTCPCLSTTPHTSTVPPLSSRVLVSLLRPKPQYSPTPQFTCACLSTTPHTSTVPPLSSRVLVSLLRPTPATEHHSRRCNRQ